MYYPPTDLSGAVLPVLVFFYGGGFTSGSRSSPPSNLVYNNLGAFFASRGVLTVIPDYRLVPSIKFPEGGEDVQEAIKWAAQRFSVDSARLFVMGHSAGGVHLATVLLKPVLFAPVAHAIRGVVLMGVPAAIPQGRPGFSTDAVQYYGSVKAMVRDHPLGLLRCVDGDHVKGLPPLRALRAGSEPRYIRTSMRTFVEVYSGKGGMVEEMELEGHDHLSPVLALYTGSGEEWGVQLVDWMMSVVHQSLTEA